MGLSLKPAPTKAEMVDIAALTADPANVRRHSARNLAAIQSSLKRFGQQKPIVIDGNSQIVAGHGMVEAAKALGWKQVAVVRTKLVGVEAAAFAIADNRAAELAEWDFENLAKSLEGIAKDFDLNELGWAQHELDPILAADWSPAAVEPVNTPEAKQRLVFTSKQWETIETAAAKQRGESDVSVAESVTQICQAFLEATE